MYHIHILNILYFYKFIYKIYIQTAMGHKFWGSNSCSMENPFSDAVAQTADKMNGPCLFYPFHFV